MITCTELSRSSVRRATAPTRPSRIAIARTNETVRNVEWFEVVETRGHVENGAIAHYQVTVKVGFRVEPGDAV